MTVQSSALELLCHFSRSITKTGSKRSKSRASEYWFQTSVRVVLPVTSRHELPLFVVYFSVQPVIVANKYPLGSNRRQTANVVRGFPQNFAAEVNRNLREIRHRNLQQKRGILRKPSVAGRKSSIHTVELSTRMFLSDYLFVSSKALIISLLNTTAQPILGKRSETLDSTLQKRASGIFSSRNRHKKLCRRSSV